MQPGESAMLKLSILNLDTYGNLLDFIEVGRERRRKGRIVAPNRASSTFKKALVLFKIARLLS